MNAPTTDHAPTCANHPENYARPCELCGTFACEACGVMTFGQFRCKACQSRASPKARRTVRRLSIGLYVMGGLNLVGGLMGLSFYGYLMFLATDEPGENALQAGSDTSLLFWIGALLLVIGACYLGGARLMQTGRSRVGVIVLLALPFALGLGANLCGWANSALAIIVILMQFDPGVVKVFEEADERRKREKEREGLDETL